MKTPALGAISEGGRFAIKISKNRRFTRLNAQMLSH